MNYQLIREALLKSASSETAYDPKTYSGGLDEHCFATAYVIQNLIGGKIVCGRINNERHAWNLLEDGRAVDFSSCQFGGDGFSPLTNDYKIHSPKTVNKRFLKFYDRVLENLKNA